MNKSDYLKDYYKTLEEAPLNVLEEYEGKLLAAIDENKAAGQEKSSKELENDLEKVRKLMDKKREK
jgi:hypothetical protein